MSRRTAILVLPALLLSLAGCGNSRVSVPSLTRAQSPSGFHSLTLPGAGVTLRVPINWLVLNERGPLVAAISSGPAVIAVWRYPPSASARTSSGTSALGLARDALLSAARARDPRMAVIRASLVKIDGQGAVELDTLQRLGGRIRRVRSTHIYTPGGELVLEEYAPPSQFHKIDHLVFSPVRHSLRLLSGGSA